MPVRKSIPSADLIRCTYLIWGDVKSGKSTFASRFPGAVFIATEDGMKGIEANRWEADNGRYVVQSWQELLDATKEVLSQTPRPTMVIIDTADNAYFLLEQHVCSKYGVDYKNDDALAYGKGTAIINAEFRRYLLKLSSQGVGLILTSHTAAAERDTKKGHVTVERPSLPEKVLPMVLGMVDFVLYCTTEVYKKDAGSDPVTRHIMFTRPAPTHVAGHRIGNLPEVIPLKYRDFAREFEAGVARQAEARAKAGSVGAAKSAHHLSTNLQPDTGAGTPPAAPDPAPMSAPAPVSQTATTPGPVSAPVSAVPAQKDASAKGKGNGKRITVEMPADAAGMTPPNPNPTAATNPAAKQ